VSPFRAEEFDILVSVFLHFLSIEIAPLVVFLQMNNLVAALAGLGPINEAIAKLMNPARILFDMCIGMVILLKKDNYGTVSNPYRKARENAWTSN
jgi:hypothetical protein